MVKKILFYGAALIALYLAVINFTGFTSDINASATGGSSIIKAFQGR